MTNIEQQYKAFMEYSRGKVTQANAGITPTVEISTVEQPEIGKNTSNYTLLTIPRKLPGTAKVAKSKDEDSPKPSPPQPLPASKPIDIPRDAELDSWIASARRRPQPSRQSTVSSKVHGPPIQNTGKNIFGRV